VCRLLALADRTGESWSMARFGRWADDDTGLVAGTTLGAYRIVERIGRGGMAEVWRAERCDGVPMPPLAVKLPLFSLDTPADRERFARERDVLASLAHPGIARLIDAGVTDAGQPYLALEHVDGLAIDVACLERGWGLHERLRMFLQVLEAVDHAHRRLVVHRDLKPSNVLVDREGRVRLLDFGVAKLLSDSSAEAERTALTQAHGCALTPRYAAPEQVGDGPISTATDIYSLGVMLFELLCGCSPYGADQASAVRCLKAVLDTDSPKPSNTLAQAPADAAQPGRAWRDALRGDLDNIVLKALRKRPEDRYRSVERFSDDLQRYLSHRPVAARPPTPWHTARLFVRRHAGASTAASVGAVVAVVLGGLALQQSHERDLARARSDTVRDFMFDLVNDAERDEAATEPTGRQMVAAAVHRARAQFAAEPRLQGELLAELGRMQGRLGDDDGSRTLLSQAVALLEAASPAGDGALHKAQAYLAAALLDDGDPAAASALANRVLGECLQGPDCAKSRYYASTVMSRHELRQGRPEAALVHSDRAVAESSAAFGPRHAETALALMGRAVVARQAGRPADAAATLDKAIEISRGQTLKLADRLAMQRTRAVLSMDLGAYDDAVTRLGEALAQAQVSVEGERRVLRRVLATVQLARGLAQPALDEADAALRDAPPGVESLLARQARARALSLLGKGEAAARDIHEVIDGLRAQGYAAASMEVLRARRYEAEIRLRQGPLAPGLALLEALARDQQAVRAGQETEFAQTLDLLGATRREAGRPQDALALHQLASQLLRARLPEGHPLLERNRLHQLAAEDVAHPSPEGRQAWLRQWEKYAALFPAQSHWRAVGARAPTQGQGPTPGTPANWLL